MNTEEQFRPGLEGIIAAETAISLLDTVDEQIVIRGYDLIELSKKHSYLEIVHLLLEGSLPANDELGTLEQQLQNKQEIPSYITDILNLLPKTTHAMDGQRTIISALAGGDLDIDNRSTVANKARAYELLAKLPEITVGSYQILSNQKVIKPNPKLSYSSNFLYMITGKEPTAIEAEIFDRSLLLYIEHEMPNSTFTSRVIASTNADMYGALAGAVASLKGNLHGGANEAVMHMLNEVDTPEGFEILLRQKLQNKEKIMGFGHRVYMRKMDPRALMMKESLQTLSDLDGDHTLLDMCIRGEKLMVDEKGLYPNLDYYAAPVYWKLGIPIPLYTPIFFSARTAGLCAHIIEQHDNNRLFRPRVKYTGERNR